MVFEEYLEESDGEDIYSEEAREDLLDSDVLTAEEDAFMRGYDEAI